LNEPDSILRDFSITTSDDVWNCLTNAPISWPIVNGKGNVLLDDRDRLGDDVFFCYRKIEVIESYLNGCKCICDARSIWGDGIIGRQMRMNMVSVVLTFPHLMYRRGDISKDANLRVPPHLRAWILWLYINLNTVFACMIGLYAFITAQ
jgi:hypothetical protein